MNDQSRARRELIAIGATRSFWCIAPVQTVPSLFSCLHNARRFFDRSEHFDRIQVVAGRPQCLLNPLCLVRAGSPAQWGKIAYRGRIRWTNQLRKYGVYVASERCVSIFGGRRPSFSKDVEHDLALAAVFCAYAKSNFQTALSLERESLFDREFRMANKKVPDARIRIEDVSAGRCIEVCGASYSAKRLRDLSESCFEMGYQDVEIW